MRTRRPIDRRTSLERKPSGEAIAAFIAPTIALFVMALTHFVDAAAPGFDQVLLRIGSWIPNYQGIGPYAGLETILLVAWLGAWGILHMLWRKKDLRVMPFTLTMLVGIATSTLLLWPPFVRLLLGG